jgi:hypothetical protein
MSSFSAEWQDGFFPFRAAEHPATQSEYGFASRASQRDASLLGFSREAKRKI